MAPDQTVISVLVQAGAVGISLALIWIVYKQNQNSTKTNELLVSTLMKIAEDHRETIERNTQAWQDNTAMLARLNERIK
jgi:hypothetical protein